MISTIAAIASGGALGAVMRYGANEAVTKSFGTEFPFGILSVNILGSFVMGLLISYFAHIWTPPPEVRSFLVTGMLGAFTTFSTFSLQFVLLVERGQPVAAVIYLLASVFCAIAALMLGMYIVRGLV